ncbi:glycosyltransferase family 2 protein [Paenibacillus sp. PR3]|uniref:Glycosyltransferase family 2 protein n=1 Tax=Paenibacillus terricola TaxID=2763503 RepID=A0ABR8MSZ7_9BACL|nr:glycosyltransferase family 2 protein [Paenibacillus terricola]MBD3918171.1 glycosyltransferase family 2 protein [Paenibacillus terricola]
MITISLCMIVKNEEGVLARCLDSVADLVDEINIIDTGSTDATKAIAARYTDRIFDFEWIDDFAAARNFAFEQATCSHMMWLDADDIMLEKDREAFKKLVAKMPDDIDSIIMEYHLAFDKAGNPAAGARRNRIVRREKGYRWYNPIHEYLDVTEGKVYVSEVAISHERMGDHSARNMEIFKKKLLQGGAKLESRNQLYYANELVDQQMYTEAAEQYEQFVRNENETAEDRMFAYSKLAECYHHLNQKQKKMQSLLLALQFAVPRADHCCSIGYSFEERGQYDAAVHWYELALTLPKPQYHMGLLNLVCWTWMPHVQLCICYAKLGQIENAYKHNEKALAYLPDDVNLLDNKLRLEQALGIAQTAENNQEPIGESAPQPDDPNGGTESPC